MPRKSHTELVTQLVVENISELTFEELCKVCDATPDFVFQLIDYGVLEPVGLTQTTWRFYPEDMRILRTAVHLHHDLEVNHAGIALVIDLMEELTDLRTQLDILQRQIK